MQRGINLQHPLTPVRDWRNDSDGELESETEWSAGGGGGRQMELVKSLSRVLYQLWQRGRHNS